MLNAKSGQNRCGSGRVLEIKTNDFYFAVRSRQLWGEEPSSRRSIVIAPGEGQMR